MVMAVHGVWTMISMAMSSRSYVRMLFVMDLLVGRSVHYENGTVKLQCGTNLIFK
jgi:hypothetical protein